MLTTILHRLLEIHSTCPSIELSTNLNLNEVASNNKQLSTPFAQANQVTQPSIQQVSEKDRVKAPLFRGKEKNNQSKSDQLVYDDAPHAWIYKGSSIKKQWIKQIDGIFLV